MLKLLCLQIESEKGTNSEKDVCVKVATLQKRVEEPKIMNVHLKAPSQNSIFPGLLL